MSNYESIKVLSEFEHIRTRPGMYIGRTDTPIHLLYEVIDNALDEAEAGYADEIRINFESTHIVIQDNGRGFPEKDDNGDDAVITSCTKLFSGGKFDKNSYKISSGLHGIGLVAVNALSEWVNIYTVRGNCDRYYVFYNGEHKDTTKNVKDVMNINKGTRVSFKPNEKYFDNVKIPISIIRQRLQLAAILIPNIKIYLNDEKVDPAEFEELLGGKVDTPIFNVEVKDDNGQSMIIWFGYNLSSNKYNLSGAVNLLPVHKGTHINEALKSLHEAWGPYIEGRSIDKYDVQIGMNMFVSVKMFDPKYTSQTKESLSITKSEFDILRDKSKKAIDKLFKDESNNKWVVGLLSKFEDYRRSLNRNNSSKYLEDILQHGELDGDGVKRRGDGSTKLLDCTSQDRSNTELFVVEGDSAGGGLIQFRDPSRHAILPLRGKVLNVIDQPLQRIMDNLEIRSLVNAIGAGAFFKQDVSKIRYEKIIILCDADDDGLNIMALLIGAICYIVPQIIEEGYLYVGECPIYGQIDKRGRYHPIFDKKNLNPDWSIQRYKGLGELNPSELKKAALDSDTRVIKKLSIDKQEIKDICKIVGTSSEKRRILELCGLIKI